ncbi:expressed unknown protein [Seminavis robusta]|uniref:Transmembrane protein n=1 Tax=Seminavis robusta TaxID=568900 RepID=A0A9N8D821_9STRA|nr:expressed unknown protein [Seminavis robusta]|eukprot:Sro31_g020081.1  (143) ;mRNA; r:27479-27907
MAMSWHDPWVREDATGDDNDSLGIRMVRAVKLVLTARRIYFTLSCFALKESASSGVNSMCRSSTGHTSSAKRQACVFRNLDCQHFQYLLSLVLLRIVARTWARETVCSDAVVALVVVEIAMFWFVVGCFMCWRRVSLEMAVK